MKIKRQRGLHIVSRAGLTIARLYSTDIGMLAGDQLTLSAGSFHTRSTVKALNTFLTEAHLAGRAYLLRGIVHVDLTGYCQRAPLSPSLTVSLADRQVSSAV